MKYFQFNFQDLKTLQTIKRGSNLKKIANDLYLSQPGLTLKIQRLESKIGTPILERQRKQIDFTRTGELTLKYVDKILQIFDEADAAMKYFKRLRKISITIGSNQLIGQYVIKRILHLFCKYYPHTYLTLILESTNFICWEIFKGNIDLGIVMGEEIPFDLHALLSIESYFKENIVLILPKSYVIENSKQIALNELYEFDFIGLLPDNCDRKIITRILRNYGINYDKLKTKFELDSADAIKRSVQAGLGVSFLSILVVRQELLTQRIQSVTINKANPNQEIMLVTNHSYYTFLLGKFYRYCLIAINPNPYLNFINI